MRRGEEYYMRRSNSLKKFKFLHKSKTAAIEKSFVKNLLKKENIFLRNSMKIL